MKVTNWNRNPVVKDASIEEFKGELLSGNEQCIRGNGRSYGDVSLDTNILSMLTWRDEMTLENNILRVSSGYTLKEVLNYVVPQGFLVPVIPGTQHVTIGGMIAGDIHGKNHERNGTIGHWVREIELLLANGDRIRCSQQENTDIFKATIGGVGLTGVVLSAVLELEPIVSTRFKQRVHEDASIEELINRLDKSTAKYKVGWWDFHRSSNFFLIETEEDDIPADCSSFQVRKPKVSVPFTSFPFVNNAAMNIYNTRFAKNLRKQKGEEINISLDETFFPLDRIRNWNRLYGMRGFYQFQFCFSREGVEEKLNSLFERIRSSGHTPMLSVIKKHGNISSPGLLSYPKPGISIAFDFAKKKNVETFLIELYKQVAELDGRIYLIKDALIERETFNTIYGDLSQFKSTVRSVNNGHFASLLSKRLNLVGDE